MTDLTLVLPNFAIQDYPRLIPSLEKNLITTTDLITLDVAEIAKRAQLPLLDLKRLCDAVIAALKEDLGVVGSVESIATGDEEGKGKGIGNANELTLSRTGREFCKRWETISTLDDGIDSALGGGIPTGYITEFAGESGAGKTQFLLMLLLSAQLPKPQGLGRATLYISTESGLPVSRLSQLLSSNPQLQRATPKPSLDRIISIVTPDLESQDHILRFQVPVAIKRHNVGLIVLDSVAANYRAEFERPGSLRNGANMAKRSAELVKLGTLLRDLARIHNLAVVVANQVADRFGSTQPQHATNASQILQQATQSSPLAHRSHNFANSTSKTVNAILATEVPPDPPSQVPSEPPTADPLTIPISQEPSSEPQVNVASIITPNVLTLDHQQRWFTGWGDDHDRFDDANFVHLPQKTPSLGLVWTSQIACRIALIKIPVYGSVEVGDDSVKDEEEVNETILKRWTRYMKVVFAPWAEASRSGVEGAVEYEVGRGGVVSKGVVENPTKR